ncbi:MAG TPA: glycoside hydrolase family 65 protein [Saprospiraceae bacterium]|nr:glycoside hydrolase family 65 protein [Saprospiraceae bacterium]
MKKALFLLVLIISHSSFIIAQGDPGMSPGKTDAWHIVADNIDPANYFGVTVANGMIGLVSSPEPMRVKDVVLNGAYDNYGRGRVSNILKGFNFMNMNLDVDGRRVTRSGVSGYKQTLDMRAAALTTTFEVGDQVTVNHKVMALRHLPYCALSVVEITAKKDVIITPASVIEAPEMLQDVRNYFSEIDRPHVLIPLLTSVGKSPSGKYTVAASTSFVFEERHGTEPDLVHEDWDYNMHLLKFSKKLKAGEKYRFAVVGTVISSAHVPDAHNEAERLTIYAALERTDRLQRRHVAEWEKLWASDIAIEGDVAATRDVHSAMYHLYSFAREGTALSLSPMGLSGLGYNGHVFWDTELWMYPPLLLLHPEIAKSLLEFRYQMLDEAKQNAFSHGYQGAMYPWESTTTGQEETPVWALTGPFQQHITGCVGWAAWQYYLVTKDKTWLRERGWPMLKEGADFWASRVERNGPGKYDINNVIGANEWQENIDNNAFTNGMAKTVLAYATDAAKELGLTPNPDWMHVADNIPILKFPDGTTRENATYDGVMIKQADVNLLAYPLKVITDPAQVKKDLDYYQQRTSPEGPAMGNAILTVLAARGGDAERAHDLWVKSYKPNEVPPFGVLAETAGGTNPYFATGAGGFLQATLMGFGGLDITPVGIVQLKTKLPKDWKSMTMSGVGVERRTFTVK